MTVTKKSVPISTRLTTPGRFISDQQQVNTKRATKLAKEGSYGKAAQALRSLGVLPATSDVIDALMDTHPQQAPDEATLVSRTFSTIYSFRPVSEKEILGAIRAFKPGSSPGGSGVKPYHLVELLRCPSSSGNSGFLAALTRLVNVLATGKAPAVLAPWIAGAPLRTLAKKDISRRPIAVEETLRRLVGSFLMKRVSQKAAGYLQPLQVGIVTKSGTDTVVHEIRKVVQEYDSDPAYELLTVDLKNALICAADPLF